MSKRLSTNRAEDLLEHYCATAMLSGDEYENALRDLLDSRAENEEKDKLLRVDVENNVLLVEKLKLVEARVKELEGMLNEALAAVRWITGSNDAASVIAGATAARAASERWAT